MKNKNYTYKIKYEDRIKNNRGFLINSKKNKKTYYVEFNINGVFINVYCYKTDSSIAMRCKGNYFIPFYCIRNFLSEKIIYKGSFYFNNRFYKAFIILLLSKKGTKYLSVLLLTNNKEKIDSKILVDDQNYNLPQGLIDITKI